MKDYSRQHGKYAIIDHNNIYAIVEAQERSVDDTSEVIAHKPDTLSISRYISALQHQLNGWYERESTPMVSGLERWKEAKVKQRRMKERVSAK
jgi:hypothetical protein